MNRELTLGVFCEYSCVRDTVSREHSCGTTLLRYTGSHKIDSSSFVSFVLISTTFFVLRWSSASLHA